MKLYDGAREAWDGFQQVTQMRAAIAAVQARHPPPAVAAAAAELDSTLLRIGGTGEPAPAGRGARGGRAAAPVPSFTTLNGVEAEEGAVLVSLNGQLKVMDMSDLPPNPSKLKAWRMVCADLRATVLAWRTVNTRNLGALDALLTQDGIAPIPAVAPALVPPVCVAPAPRPAGRGDGGRPGI